MMNFKSFITEEITQEQILSTLQRDCTMFINEVGNLGLYRGIKSPHPGKLLNKIVSRSDRYPKHTRLSFHNSFNQAFKEIHGVDNIRSQAVFCAGTKDNNYYGKMFRIFPIGHYEYWWSKKINDLFEWLSERTLGIEDFSDMVDIVKKGLYIDTDLTLAITKYEYTEVMLLCDSYYAIPIKENDELLKDLDNEL